MLFGLFVAFSGVVRAAAQETLWQGTWTDPVLGGSINVCVDVDSNGIYWGQALMSDAGYMRGKITVDGAGNAVWDGKVAFGGQQAPWASFSYSIPTTAQTTFKVQSYQVVPYPSSTYPDGTQQSTARPPDQECFAVDDPDFLNNGNFSYSGSWYSDQGTPWYSSVSSNYYYASYYYVWQDGTPADAYNFGSITDKFASDAVGQVMQSSWYEAGNVEGIQLAVAKNATAYYYTWWYITSMTYFDYTTKKYNSNYGYSQVSRLATTPYQSATMYACLELDNSDAESSCFADSEDVVVNQTSYFDTCSISNDDDGMFEGSDGTVISTLVFLVVNFLMGLYLVANNFGKMSA
jgi:hypothetical protein